jgi:Cellulose binding domain
LTAAFRQIQSWNGGYQAEYTITNRGTAAVTGWTVVVTFSGGVNPNYWDADAVTGTDNRITFTAKSYNATVPAGGSVTFGMVVSGSPPATPVACTVNGRAC